MRRATSWSSIGSSVTLALQLHLVVAGALPLSLLCPNATHPSAVCTVTNSICIDPDAVDKDGEPTCEARPVNPDGSCTTSLGITSSTATADASTPTSTTTIGRSPPSGHLSARNCTWSSKGRLAIAESVNISCAYPCASPQGCLCSLGFQFASGIDIATNGAIVAGSIALDAQKGLVHVGRGARLNTDGLGYCMAPVHAIGRKFMGIDGAGAGHGGSGGGCKSGHYGLPDVGAAYGDATDEFPPTLELYGEASASSDGKSVCCGGGAITITAREAFVMGVISSDAQRPCSPCVNVDARRRVGDLPCCPPLPSNQACHGLGGAAGGTVRLISPAINGSGMVSARGGDADPSLPSAGGGSGGRVWIASCGVDDWDSSVDASGGYASSTGPVLCEDGAAGTIFGLSCAGKSNLVRVDNRGRALSADSLIVGARRGGGRSMSAEPRLPVFSLSVGRGASLVPDDETCNVSAADEIIVSDNSKLTTNGAAWLTSRGLYVQSSSLVTSRRVSSGGLMHDTVQLDVTELVEVDELSSIQPLSVAHVGGMADIRGLVQGPPVARASLFVHGLLSIGLMGSVSASTLVLEAASFIIAGRVKATDSSSPGTAPTANSTDLPALKCPPNLTAGYKLALDVQNVSFDTGGVLAAQSIIICAEHAQLEGGLVTAKALGHASGEGQGAGCSHNPHSAAPAGAGSGAGHGGVGGDSIVVRNVSSCGGGGSYGVDSAPASLGSGGGGEGGGDGGGIIHLQARSQLSFGKSGALDASGGDARVDITPQVESGGGGGSGGSIHVEAHAVSTAASTKAVAGGQVLAEGGAGAAPGGAGGAGGRIALFPLPWEAHWKTPLSEKLLVVFSTPLGGDGFGATPAGDGSIRGSNCAEGRGGLLCEPCKPGSEKPGVGSSPCELCMPGHFSNSSGTAACQLCPAGMSAPANGSTSCSVCVAGTVAPVAGTAECDRCPAPPLHGFFSLNNSCAVQCKLPFFLYVHSSGASSCGLFFEIWLERVGTTLIGGPAVGQLVVFLPALIAAAIVAAIACLHPRYLRASALTRSGAEAEPRAAASEVEPPRGTDGSGISTLPLLAAGERGAVNSSYAVSSPDCGGVMDAAPLQSPAPAPPLRDTGTRDTTWTRETGDSARSAGERVALWHQQSPDLSVLCSVATWERHKYRARQHVQRIYLTGSNSPMEPWGLPAYLAADVRSLVHLGNYNRFAERLREESRWSMWELGVYALLASIPTLQRSYLQWRRKEHYRRLVALTGTLIGMGEADSIWRSLSKRVWEGHRLELGACTEFQLGWFDIFSNIAAPLSSAPGRTRKTTQHRRSVLKEGDSSRSGGGGGGGGRWDDDASSSDGLTPDLRGRPRSRTTPPAASLPPGGLPPTLDEQSRGSLYGYGSILNAPVVSPIAKQRQDIFADFSLSRKSPPGTLTIAHPEPVRLGTIKSGVLAEDNGEASSLETPACSDAADRRGGSHRGKPATRSKRSGTIDDPARASEPDAADEGGLGHFSPRSASSFSPIYPFNGAEIMDRGPSPPSEEQLLGPGFGRHRSPSPLSIGDRDGFSALSIAPDKEDGRTHGGEPPPEVAAPNRTLKPPAVETPHAASSSALEPLSAPVTRRAGLSASVESPGVRFRLYLCGAGTYTSPYHLDTSDFLVYASLHAAMGEASNLVAKCLNVRLCRIDRWSTAWRVEMRDFLRLLDAINAQLEAEAAARGGAHRWRLALVCLPSTSQLKQQAIFVSVDAPPEAWQLPTGATVLTSAACDDGECRLPGFAHPWAVIGAIKMALLGAPRHAPLRRSTVTCLLLFLVAYEVILLIPMMTTVCAAGGAGLLVCAASLLLLPLASLGAPLAALATMVLLGVSGLRRFLPRRRAALASTVSLGDGAMGGAHRVGSQQAWLMRAARDVAQWNAASVVNALVLLCFSAALPSVSDLFTTSLYWLMPLSLLLCKLLTAQALKPLTSVSGGLSDAGWRLLSELEESI